MTLGAYSARHRERIPVDPLRAPKAVKTWRCGGLSIQLRSSARASPLLWRRDWQCPQRPTSLPSPAAALRPCAWRPGHGGLLRARGALCVTRRLPCRWCTGLSMVHGFSVYWPGCPAAPAVARTATASRTPTTAVTASGTIYGPWKPDMAACGADAAPISNAAKPAQRRPAWHPRAVRAQYGRGHSGRGQLRGRRRVPDRGQDETAPGQVQHCRSEQHHGDQMPAGPGPGGRSRLLAIGDVPAYAAVH